MRFEAIDLFCYINIIMRRDVYKLFEKSLLDIDK